MPVLERLQLRIRPRQIDNPTHRYDRYYFLLELLMDSDLDYLQMLEPAWLLPGEGPAKQWSKNMLMTYAPQLAREVVIKQLMSGELVKFGLGFYFEVLVKLLDEQMIPFLLQRSQADDFQATMALAKAGHLAAVEPLSNFLMRKHRYSLDKHSMISAAYQLGRLGDERVVEALIIGMGDKDHDVRRESKRALRKLKPEMLEPDSLLSLLASTDPSIRKGAADGLWDIDCRPDSGEISMNELKGIIKFLSV